MFEKQTVAGYDLYQPFQGTDQWVVDLKNGTAYHGTFLDISVYMVKQLGFEIDSIEEGVLGMIETGDNAIHFGAFQTLLYTFEKEIDNRKVG